MLIGPPIFPVFNDHLLTSMEPINDADIVPFIRSDNADMNFATNCAWSSDTEWFFVVLPEGIALWNVYSRNGLLCQKQSGSFIGHCLDSGLLSSSIRKRGERPNVKRTALRSDEERG